MFCNKQQNNWSDLLLAAKFAYNNHSHPTIGMTPFRANYGYDLALTGEGPTRGADIPLRLNILTRLHEQCKEWILSAQKKQETQYAKRVRDAPPLKVDDLVWISSKDLLTDRPLAKLEALRYGPYPIVEVRGPLMYRVKLPEGWRVHNTFHRSKLTPASKDDWNRTTNPVTNPDHSSQRVYKEEEQQPEALSHTRTSRPTRTTQIASICTSFPTHSTTSPSPLSSALTWSSLQPAHNPSPLTPGTLTPKWSLLSTGSGKTSTPPCPPLATTTAAPRWSSPTTRPGGTARTSLTPQAPHVYGETGAHASARARLREASEPPHITPFVSLTRTWPNPGKSRTQSSRSPALHCLDAPPPGSIPPMRPSPTPPRSLSGDHSSSMTTTTGPSPPLTTLRLLPLGLRSSPPTSTTSRSRSFSGSSTRSVTTESTPDGPTGTVTTASARSGSTGTGLHGADQENSWSGVPTLKGGSGMSHHLFPVSSPFLPDILEL